MLTSTSTIIQPTSTDDKPTHVINLNKQVIKVEMSPFEWSRNVICIAHVDEVVIGIIKFQEEDEEMEADIDLEIVKSFKINKRVHSISWSPETSLNLIPKNVKFACGTSSNIYIYSTNITDKSGEQELTGHNSYVNALSYDSYGDLLASTSDDLTCRLWAVKEGNTCISTFVLKSPGVAVCWHQTDPGKLMVAESSGTVRLYNTQRQQAILSCDTKLAPLTAADWSPTNRSRITAIAAGHLLVWDITRFSQPLDVRVIHPEGGSLVRFSPQSEKHIASVGQHDKLLKVTHLNLENPVCIGNLTLSGGLTWTCHLPYVCVGRDRSLCFWKVAIK